MYSSDTQAEVRYTLPLHQSDITPGTSDNEYELNPLIDEIERIQHEQMILEIEQLQIEELKIELSQLKWGSFHKLQQLLKQQNFPYAIAYIDSLAQRLPNDMQVCEWQASAYLRWGRHLSKEKDLKKARSCFKKALTVMTKSSSLHPKIQQEFQGLSQMFY